MENADKKKQNLRREQTGGGRGTRVREPRTRAKPRCRGAQARQPTGRLQPSSRFSVVLLRIALRFALVLLLRLMYCRLLVVIRAACYSFMCFMRFHLQIYV